jgi:hypothetical protein
MKKTAIVVMCFALIVCVAACASSDIKRTTTADGVGANRVSVAKATVVEVDPEQHTAVLKDADGTLQYLNFGPDAHHLDQVKVGDTVIAEVIEFVEVVVDDASASEPGVGVFETAQRNPDRPGAQKVTVTEASARVEKINYEERLITLSGQDGKRITVEAGPEVKRLERIRQGDMISLRKVTQVIIRVETP